MLTRDLELWACALWVEKEHGETGPKYIADQVQRFAQEGNREGVAAWRAIADRYDALVDGIAVPVRQ